MGIKMKFALLISYAIAAPGDCTESGVHGKGPKGGCSGDSDDRSGYPSCCDGAAQSFGGAQQCMEKSDTCAGNGRRLLKEEDDFDALDDLELEGTGGGWGG